MQEAILVVETGFSPQELDGFPEPTLERILLYKEVRHLSLAGGSFNG